MKNKIVARFIFFIFAIAIFLPFSSFASPVPESFADLSEKLSPAVVNISTTQVIKSPFKNPYMKKFEGNPDFDEFQDFFEKFFGPYTGDRKAQSLGSGFIIDPEGYIATNNHVIDGAEEIDVTLPDNSQYKAKVIGKDSKTDLALLKIDAKTPLPYVRFGDSEKSRVGDWVVVIGNPFGLGGSVTAGIISARARDINSGPFDDYIQTDAAINRGNSGGPMFNINGEVIGINTAIFSPNGGGNVGIGFAVPSGLAEPILKQLREKGSIKRGWLGVKIQVVTEEIAESLGLGSQEGALVSEVMKGTPAEKAGIKAGDIVLKFDGKEISMMKKLPRIVAETPIGKTVEVEILSDGKKKITSVTIAELDERAEEEAKSSSPKDDGTYDKDDLILGMLVSPANEQSRKKYGLADDITGLVIEDVSPNSAAAENGLSMGDVIIEANQKKILTKNDLKEAVKNAENKGRKSILLLLNRQGEVLYMALPLKEKE